MSIRSLWPHLAGTALTAGLAACAAVVTTSDPAPPSAVPDTLQPPAGATLVLKTHATGVQIYACQPAKDDAARLEWALQGPEATLFDADGQAIGRHFAGPSWETADGSRVVGELRAKDPGPDPDAVPWLLLAAKTNTGSGALSTVAWVQRRETSGGRAPAAGCDAEHSGTALRVPYQANYYFYSAAP
jgi:hypothetical protein